MPGPTIEAGEDVLAPFRKQPKTAVESENSIQCRDIADERDPSGTLIEVDDPETSSIDLSLQSSADVNPGPKLSNNGALHDLCTQATSRGDRKWGDVVTPLSTQPHLAMLLDNGWTPLHISCLGSFAPPDFFVHALLTAAPGATQVLDNGGRLPLHLLAATSADPDVMQLLVDEYPCAITSYDDKGMLPLHTLFKIETIH